MGLVVTPAATSAAWQAADAAAAELLAEEQRSETQQEQAAAKAATKAAAKKAKKHKQKAKKQTEPQQPSQQDIQPATAAAAADRTVECDRTSKSDSLSPDRLVSDSTVEATAGGDCSGQEQLSYDPTGALIKKEAVSVTAKSETIPASWSSLVRKNMTASQAL